MTAAERPGAHSDRARVGRAGARRRGRARGLVMVVAAVTVIGLAGWAIRRELAPEALVLAEQAVRRGDWAAATHHATRHLSARPRSRTAARIAARGLTQLGRLDEAEPLYRRAGALPIEDRQAWAFALVAAGRSAEAEAVYRGILADAPNDVLALRRLAAVLMTQNRWEEALAVARRLTEVPQGRVIGLTLAGVIHHNREQPDDAVAAFDRVLEIDPQLKEMPLRPRSMFWIYCAQDLLEIGRSDDAAAVLQRAIAEGDDALLRDLLGQARMQSGDLEGAERAWRRSVELKPRRPFPWLMLGNLALQQGRPEEAVGPLETAVALAPEAAEPAYSLSRAYRHLRDDAQADRFAERARRLRAGTLDGGLKPPRMGPSSASGPAAAEGPSS